MSPVFDTLKAADPNRRIEVGRSEGYCPQREHGL
jgi:hypothetical protein